MNAEPEEATKLVDNCLIPGYGEIEHAAMRADMKNPPQEAAWPGLTGGGKNCTLVLKMRGVRLSSPDGGEKTGVCGGRLWE